MNYVKTHYSGHRAARILQTERDVDRGVRVYDVRILAPNGTVYVVHVGQRNNRVLWVNRAESQGQGEGEQHGRHDSHSHDAGERPDK